MEGVGTGVPFGYVVTADAGFTTAKERKKTDNPREGWVHHCGDFLQESRILFL